MAVPSDDESGGDESPSHTPTPSCSNTSGCFVLPVEQRTAKHFAMLTASGVQQDGKGIGGGCYVPQLLTVS
jgi:hypothetical protein